MRWMAVGHEGDMKICPHSTAVFGDAANDSIMATWNNKILPFVVQRISDSISEQCSQCILLNRCKGGCHLNAINKA